MTKGTVKMTRKCSIVILQGKRVNKECVFIREIRDFSVTSNLFIDQNEFIIYSLYEFHSLKLFKTGPFSNLSPSGVELK